MQLVHIHEGQTKTYPLVKNKTYILGRGSTATLRIVDPAISRQHLEIACQDDHMLVRDLGSRHAFTVEGTKSIEAQLKNGQKFNIHNHTFVFKCADDAPLTPPTVPPSSIGQVTNQQPRIIVFTEGRQINISLKNNESKTVGRNRRCDIVIPSEGISRQHLKMTATRDMLDVTDLNSRNGFQVNGQHTRQAQLSHNQSFTIGDIRFVFQTHEDIISLSAFADGDLDEILPNPVTVESIPEHQKVIVSSHKSPFWPVTVTVILFAGVVWGLQSLGLFEEHFAPPSKDQVIVIQDPQHPITEPDNHPFDKAAYQKFLEESVDFMQRFKRHPIRRAHEFNDAMNRVTQALRLDTAKQHETASTLIHLYPLLKVIYTQATDLTPAQIEKLNQASKKMQQDPMAPKTASTLFEDLLKSPEPNTPDTNITPVDPPPDNLSPREQFLKRMQEEFDNMQMDAVRRQVKLSEYKDDPKIQRLLRQMEYVASEYQKGSEALENNDYLKAKAHLNNVIAEGLTTENNYHYFSLEKLKKVDISLKNQEK